MNAREFVANDKARQEIKVHTQRLDDVIPPEAKIDFMKIDVEGAEGLVISGALDTIRRNRPYIILEHGHRSSNAFGFSSSDIYDLLVDRCGLELSLLNKWLYRGRALSKGEFVGGNDWYFLAHPADLGKEHIQPSLRGG